jgi:hypothetical protein
MKELEWIVFECWDRSDEAEPENPHWTQVVHVNELPAFSQETAYNVEVRELGRFASFDEADRAAERGEP